MKSFKVSDGWNLYWMAILASSKKRSQITETGRWKNYIEPILGHIPLKNLTTLDYFHLRRSIEEKKLSPQTVYHCLSLLRRILKKSVEWGKFNGNIPSFQSVFPKFDNKRQRFLSKDEADHLLSILSLEEETQNWHDISLFALSTGLRKGEIFNLDWTHVDFTNRFLLIVDTKSGKNRNIPMNDATVDLLIKKKNPLSIWDRKFLRKERQKYSIELLRKPDSTMA